LHSGNVTDIPETYRVKSLWNVYFENMFWNIPETSSRILNLKFKSASTPPFLCDGVQVKKWKMEKTIVKCCKE